MYIKNLNNALKLYNKEKTLIFFKMQTRSYI